MVTGITNDDLDVDKLIQSFIQQIGKKEELGALTTSITFEQRELEAIIGDFATEGVTRQDVISMINSDGFQNQLISQVKEEFGANIVQLDMDIDALNVPTYGQTFGDIEPETQQNRSTGTQLNYKGFSANMGLTDERAEDYVDLNLTRNLQEKGVLQPAYHTMSPDNQWKNLQKLEGAFADYQLSDQGAQAKNTLINSLQAIPGTSRFTPETVDAAFQNFQQEYKQTERRYHDTSGYSLVNAVGRQNIPEELKGEKINLSYAIDNLAKNPYFPSYVRASIPEGMEAEDIMLVGDGQNLQQHFNAIAAGEAGAKEQLAQALLTPQLDGLGPTGAYSIVFGGVNAHARHLQDGTPTPNVRQMFDNESILPVDVNGAYKQAGISEVAYNEEMTPIFLDADQNIIPQDQVLSHFVPKEKTGVARDPNAMEKSYNSGKSMAYRNTGGVIGVGEKQIPVEEIATELTPGQASLAIATLPSKNPVQVMYSKPINPLDPLAPNAPQVNGPTPGPVPMPDPMPEPEKGKLSFNYNLGTHSYMGNNKMAFASLATGYQHLANFGYHENGTAFTAGDLTGGASFQNSETGVGYIVREKLGGFTGLGPDGQPTFQDFTAGTTQSIMFQNIANVRTEHWKGVQAGGGLEYISADQKTSYYVNTVGKLSIGNAIIDGVPVPMSDSQIRNQFGQYNTLDNPYFQNFGAGSWQNMQDAASIPAGMPGSLITGPDDPFFVEYAASKGQRPEALWERIQDQIAGIPGDKDKQLVVARDPRGNPTIVGIVGQYQDGQAVDDQAVIPLTFNSDGSIDMAQTTQAMREALQAMGHTEEEVQNMVAQFQKGAQAPTETVTVETYRAEVGGEIGAETKMNDRLTVGGKVHANAARYDRTERNGEVEIAGEKRVKQQNINVSADEVRTTRQTVDLKTTTVTKGADIYFDVGVGKKANPDKTKIHVEAGVSQTTQRDNNRMSNHGTVTNGHAGVGVETELKNGNSLEVNIEANKANRPGIYDASAGVTYNFNGGKGSKDQPVAAPSDATLAAQDHANRYDQAMELKDDLTNELDDLSKALKKAGTVAIGNERKQEKRNARVREEFGEAQKALGDFKDVAAGLGDELTGILNGLNEQLEAQLGSGMQFDMPQPAKATGTSMHR